ncbi:hypothetical protein Pcinc_034568 [Petrolisthes cinctipes]|uniref:Homeodomain-like domain-containing protein n=1 Tax=Petrolisthes cinctipes TaxID=88211 RepID=A0AAE1C1E0_PETCI|nr:hypothetical protein Pcinc_034568 [Petrolisthes cinctipes]
MNRQQTAIAKRAQIIALHDKGLSSRVIAQRLAVSRTTVQKWIHRHEEIGNLLDAAQTMESSTNGDPITHVTTVETYSRRPGADMSR